MATDLFCRNTTFLHESVTESHIVPVLEKRQVVPLMLVGFGGLSTMLAIIHHLIRKYVYKDSHNLDTVFDAGGRVSFGLTAVTVTSQLLWPADFLLQGTLMAKMGLGGTLFYNIAVVMSILIFPLLSLTIKSRAPGAKTFLQIVYTRYGTPAHVVFCIIALLANGTVLMALILSAKAAMDVLVKDISDELLVLILAFLFGSYCLLGGLGTTFYISYFTTAFTIVGTLVFVMVTRYNYDADQFMSPERLYTAMSCLNTTNGNTYVTFRSRSGVIYGVITLLLSVSLSVCDQANWQSRIAAKPTEGVIGFFIAAYVWFAIPLTMSMAAASVYLSSSYQNGTYLLTAKDIDAGFIPPYVMQSIMGKSGAFLLLSILTWSLMSTGSGEIMAISSILVYDIYKVYIYPFRRDGSASKCLFCGKDRLFESDSHEKCNCLPASSCQACALDTKKRENAAKHDVVYECNIHGRYRRYEDRLLHKKTWCMLWVTLFIIPYLLLIIHSGMDLNWVMFVLLGSMSSFLPPIVLTLVWAKCTSHGIMAGSIGGGISYFAGLFLIAELAYEDGLQNFLVNTSQDYSLLAAIISGFVVSLILTVTTSMVTNKVITSQDVSKVWATTMAIDNPLSPWRAKYKEELRGIGVFDDVRVTLQHMNKMFKVTWRVAGIGGFVSLCLFGVILPACVLSLDVLSFGQYSAWITFCQVWLVIGAIFAIFVPPIEEISQVFRDYKKRIKMNMDSETVANNDYGDEHYSPLKDVIY